MAAITLLSGWVTILGIGMDARYVITIPAASITTGTDTLDVSSLFNTGCFSVQQSATTDAPALSADKYTDKSVTLALSQADEICTIMAWGV